MSATIVCMQSESDNLQKKFNLSLDVHEVGELGYEVSSYSQTYNFYFNPATYLLYLLKLEITCEIRTRKTSSKKHVF